MNCKQKQSYGSNSINNMDNIVYKESQMKDFLKTFIDPPEILKMSWLNVKINSLKLNKQTIELDSTGWTN